MLTSVLNLLIFGMCGFIAMFLAYKPQINKYMQTLDFELKMLPLPYIWGLYALGIIAAYFAGGTLDFIEPLNWIRVIWPLIAAALIYAAFELFGGFMFYATVIVAVAVTVWIQPLGIGAPFAPLSPRLIQLSAFVFGVIFCLSSRILNILPHTFILPNIAILLGLCILYLVGATPIFVALSAVVLTGILFAYLSLNYYDIKIDINDGACVAIAYLVCNLLLMNLGEFCFPSCIVFTMVLWAELLAAIWRKYGITHSGMLRENTNFYLAAQIFTLQGLAANIVRICAVLMFIGWFQLFAVNQYSLLIVALCLALWLDNSMSRGAPRTFKEINREFINELKQNINETKNLFNKDDKDNK